MSDKEIFPLEANGRVLGLQDWHAGYWMGDKNQTLEETQQSLNALVLKCIPRALCRILYLGCGSSALADLLARQGHEVVVPDLVGNAADHGLKDGYPCNPALAGSDFFASVDEQGWEPGSFEVIIFHDSLKFFARPEELCRKARLLLKEKGRVVFCDEVLFDPSLQDATAPVLRKDLVTAFYESGFYIKKQMDITEPVAGTCDYYISRLKNLADKHLKSGGTESDKDFQNLSAFWQRRKAWYASGQAGYLLLNLVLGDIFIRPYRSGDEQKILPVFNQVFGTDRTMDHWTWKFADNPFGQKMISLAVDSEENIAAHYSAYPVRFCSAFPGYESFMSCQAGDTMTSPQFRNVGLGPTSVLSRTAEYFYEKFCSGGFPFMYGFNTGNIRKFGERYLGYIYNQHVPYYVLDRDNAETGKWHFLKNRLLNRVTARRIERLEYIFDPFYDTVKNHFSLMVARDLKYLKWRYFDAPDTDYLVYGLFNKSLMNGWAVFKRQDDRLIMGDFLLDRDNAQSAGLIVEYAFKDNPWAKSITAWCSPSPAWCSQALTRAGFEAQEEPNRLAPGFRVFDDFFSADFFQNNFYYTMGDSDLF